MIRSSRRIFATLVMVASGVFASAQIPDLINAFDAGGRSLGVGSSLGATGSGPSAAINNPAGLGYSTTRQFSATFRNLSESRSRWSRSFTDPDISTDMSSGNRSLTQAGYSLPLMGGTLGLNYSVTGYIKDLRTGTNLVDGETIIRNLSEELRAKTDMFALSWGKASKDYRQAWGVGIVLASHNTRNNLGYQLFDNSGTPGDTSDDVFLNNESVENSGSLFGIGAVAGLQFNPSADLSIGFSVRTPITLNGDAEVEDYFNKIPGRFVAGVAKRLNQGVRENDFILLGGQIEYFFGGEDAILSRDDTQTAFGFGAEYNYRFRDAYIPIRLGFRTVGEGGTGFQRTSALTWGLGYNPDKSNFSFDLDFGSNNLGGTDLSLSLSYRFKN